MESNTLILGFDEVGRGPLAGPVVVACVLNNTYKPIMQPKDVVIRDSKRMTLLQREKSSAWILSSFPYGIGQVEASEIDKIGISNAVVTAARKAMGDLQTKEGISYTSVKILVDGREEWFPGCKPIIRGDESVPEISMAAIVAKVYRDNLMKNLSLKYPGWGFEQHVGYGTKAHCKMIYAKGLLKGVHRFSFCRSIVKPKDNQ
jgi:ribonuclease HII